MNIRGLGDIMPFSCILVRGLGQLNGSVDKGCHGDHFDGWLGRTKPSAYSQRAANSAHGLVSISSQSTRRISRSYCMNNSEDRHPE